MTNFEWLPTLPALASGHWAGIGSAATVLIWAAFRLVKRMLFPRRQTAAVRPRRSLADAVTWVCAAAAVVISGEGVFEVLQRAAPGVWWLPWLGVGLLEGPLLAFALRAKEAIDDHRDPAPDIRMTWVLAGLSSVISATSTFTSGSASVFLLRAITPIVGAILWHHALKIEQDKTGAAKPQSRWKWTPEYLATRLGLVTARASNTEDAEVHMRLTKVADAVIRYARAAVRNRQWNTQRNTGWNSAWNNGWNTFRRWRLERVYRAAERDLDLTRNTDRRALLEQIIAARHDAVLLTLLAGCVRPDLGLPEMEQPEQSAVEQGSAVTRILFHTITEQARPNGRNTRPKDSGTPGRNSRNGGRGTGGGNTRNSGNSIGRNTGEEPRNSDRNALLERIDAAIAENISPRGEVPVRALAKDLGIPASTLHRRVTKFRQEHGITTPADDAAEREADEVIAELRSGGNGHATPADLTQPLATVATGSDN